MIMHNQLKRVSTLRNSVVYLLMRHVQVEEMAVHINEARLVPSGHTCVACCSARPCRYVVEA